MQFTSVILNLLVAAALCYLRISGEKHQSFQAIAHIYVGALLMGWWLTKPPASRFYLGIAVFLTLVETACFFYFKHHQI